MPVLGDIRGCPVQPQDTGTGGPGHLCGVTAARLPQAVARAGAHLLMMESLQLGCGCHLLCRERVFSLSPPLLGLLSLGLGWRVGNPSAFRAEVLSKRRHSQQARRQAEVLFPRGALDRSPQQDRGAGRLSTACPASQLMAAFGPRILLPISPSRGGAGKPLPCSWLSALLPPPADLPPRLPGTEHRCRSQRCQALPVPGAAVGRPPQTRLPTLPVLPPPAVAAPATGSSLAPTVKTAAAPPGGDANAAAGRISLSSWRGFLRV